MGNQSQSVGASPAVWDHTVLLVTQHRWTRPAITPARQAGTRFYLPRRDGRLSWPGWLVTYKDGLPVLKTVTHPSTNRARRWLTSLMRPTTLPTKPNCHHGLCLNIVLSHERNSSLSLRPCGHHFQLPSCVCRLSSILSLIIVSLSLFGFSLFSFCVFAFEFVFCIKKFTYLLSLLILSVMFKPSEMAVQIKFCHCDEIFSDINFYHDYFVNSLTRYFSNKSSVDEVHW